MSSIGDCESFIHPSFYPSIGDCESFEEKMEGLKIYFDTKTLDFYRRKRTCLLELACRESNIEIVRYLLSIGISIGIDSNRINNALEECMFRIVFYELLVNFFRLFATFWS